MLTSEYEPRVLSAVLNENTFRRAVFSGQRAGMALPWIKVVVKPVEIKGERLLQFAYYDNAKCITKNYPPAAVAEHLTPLLEGGFKTIHVESTTEQLQVQITREGNALIRRGKADPLSREVSLTHDRPKQLVLPANSPDPFLRAIGIMTEAGKVKAEQQSKFRQLNEFLKIVDQTVSEATSRGDLDLSRVDIVDCGCGNAYLSFATYHYFSHIRHIPTYLVGIDLNAEPIGRRIATARELAWENLKFHVGSIIDYDPPRPPSIVLSLHACDTATDEALAQAVAWNSSLIFSVPCCHHDIQKQLTDQPTIAPFGPVLRHGILRERLGDVLTDAFRALILRILGYQTDVIQFISTEHTAKNVMIRAARRFPPGDAKLAREYQELKALWQVTPHLEKLLGAESRAFLVPQDESVM